nr:hypothetical protein [Tanacetum cinerariifolium]
MKWYEYGHVDEIEVRRDDQQLYIFKEDERYDLNVALRMFTKRIVIQRRVEDLQLSVKSYHKKLNLTKPDTFRSGLRKRTAYTTYSDPQGVIYVDRNNRNRLIRTDELHKFTNGALNYVRTALQHISSGLRMDYMPKKKWSNLEKRRARVMIQDIKKQLFQRRLMRNLERFVGEREYEEDLRLLERTVSLCHMLSNLISAGNLVKEILFKLNLPGHRSIPMDSKIYVKMDVEVPGSSRLKDS